MVTARQRKENGGFRFDSGLGRVYAYKFESCLNCLYASVSGIGNAAVCKIVASAFLVQVQGDAVLQSLIPLRGVR